MIVQTYLLDPEDIVWIVSDGVHDNLGIISKF